MSVNLPPLEALLPVPGVQVASAGAAIKSPDRDDIALFLTDPGTTMAGVFTRNRFRAPPVELADSRLLQEAPRALLINSGNANAATGAAGRLAAEQLCAGAAEALGLEASQVLPFSTGVIGEALPVARMAPAIDRCARSLEATPAAWAAAARAIMTTDTAPKALSRELELAGEVITVTGMAKGSGMIKPDMATMLAYLFCDACVARSCLTQLVKELADGSFNRITIDADTSTNDAFMLAATGQRGPLVENVTSDAYGALREGLLEVARELAQRVVRDGEGATKFVTVRVSGAGNEAEAARVAYTLAESPLVKTALFAGDPNWGRFCMAIGRAGIDDLDQAQVDVWLGDVRVVREGCVDPDYEEARGAAVMARDELTLRAELGRGRAGFELWTSDLSYEYVRINAEYRS